MLKEVGEVKMLLLSRSVIITKYSNTIQNLFDVA